MSDIDTLRAALETIDTQGHFAFALLQGVDAALAPAAPPGDPHTIETQAKAYQAAAKQSDSALEDTLKVKTSQLPQSWRGQAAESATQALQALHDWVAANQKALSTGDQTLSQWANQLRTAQQQDAQGHGQLSAMRPLLQQLLLDDLINPKAAAADVLVLSRLQDAAASACHDRLSAHELATSAADDATKVLHGYATWAVDDVPVLLAPGIDPLTAIKLAAEAEGAPPEAAAGIRRAAQQLQAMSPTDRTTFENLAAKASSPLEASYLWRALGAGYTVKQVQGFGSVIHGRSDAWLTQHLDVTLTNPDKTPGGGLPWANSAGKGTLNQNTEHDCVPASIVAARLSADPVLTLAVTTGQGPMARTLPEALRPGGDSASATTARIQALYNEYYFFAQLADGGPPHNGVGKTGELLLDNGLLKPVTGSTYQDHYLATGAAREAVLPNIEAAVDAGKPVPMDVEDPGGTSGHQEVIVGHWRNELEVFDPTFGGTGWVTEQQFADATLNGGAGPGIMNTAFDVQLPNQP